MGAEKDINGGNQNLTLGGRQRVGAGNRVTESQFNTENRLDRERDGRRRHRSVDPGDKVMPEAVLP